MSCEPVTSILQDESVELMLKRVERELNGENDDCRRGILEKAKASLKALLGPPEDSRNEKQANAACNDRKEKAEQILRDAGLQRHAPAALCLSGGGIRSATFNLGVLQRLAWHGLLEQFDYLSTVSGGGFIGSWLMAWACRQGGIDKVAQQLARGRVGPQEAEPPPVRYLRDYSRYLSPRFSILSVDLWTLVAIYIRNLVLNWLVLIPLILAALMVPRISVALVELFPLLEVQNETPEAQKPVPPINVTVNASTPGGKTTVLVNQSPEPSSQPKTGISESEGINPFGTAPANYVTLCYLLGLLFLTIAFVFAVWKEPRGFEALAQTCRPPGEPDDFPVPPDNPCLEKPRYKHTFQAYFIWFCLVPFVLSGCFFALGWGWDEHQTANNYFAFVIFFAVSMEIIAWVTASIAGKGGHILQVMASATGGFTAGTLLWLSARLLEWTHQWAGGLFTGHCSAASYGWETSIYVCLAVPLAILSLGGGAMLRTGILSRAADSNDAFREWWSRFGGWTLIASMLWLLLSALVLLAPGLLLYAQTAWSRAAWAALGGVSGLATILLGKSGRTPATEDAARPSGRREWISRIALALAAPVFVGLFIAFLSLATDALFRARLPVWQYAPAWLVKFDQSHLNQFPPSASGLEAHFAMVEVYDDLTECDKDVQAFLKKAKPSTTFHPDLNLFSRLVSLFKSPWGWHAAIDPYQNEESKAATTTMKLELDEQLDVLLFLTIWLAIFACLGFVSSLVINLNRFSLQATYRNRLVRAYLGASRTKRKPDPFTSFDEKDNFAVSALQCPRLPIHVINMALNLAGQSHRLSWQDRKAESFTVSPFHCGSAELGYRRTRYYGGAHGISLGTAMAISGAAVSPNMGSHSSPAISFLLTLFNVRLGSWLGNPGRAGNKTYCRPAPKNGALHVFAEAIGATDETHEYVYLSDGGHFENLGLYEMVRRRCRYIVVCDGGADPDYGFEDLANAVRKIRIDFGISIVFDPSVSIVGLDDRDVASGKYCAIGSIKYDPADSEKDGFLLYIKPAFYKRNEPVDVRGYAVRQKAFPQEPTANQFFAESQFESYRALGEHIIDEIQWNRAAEPTLPKAQTLEQFRRKVQDVFKTQAPRPGCCCVKHCCCPPGPKGDPGPQGERGPQGEPGPRGECGPEGEHGPQGEPGPKGDQGPQGEPGLQGIKGEPGQTGCRGDVGPIGPKGDRGADGPPGEQGCTGPRGCKGDDGPAGPRGEPGPRGPKGDEGPAGPKGESGPRGPKGDEGPAGPKGDPGPRGPKGDEGPAGPKGDAGPPGPKGEPGLSGPKDQPGPVGPNADPAPLPDKGAAAPPCAADLPGSGDKPPPGLAHIRMQ